MNLIVKLFYQIIDGIGAFARETEMIGLEIAVLIHSGAWWCVILGPWKTVLLDKLTSSEPEWAWGAALSLSFVGHLALIFGREIGQNLYWNLRLRNFICIFDVGLYLYILWSAIVAHVPFAIGTSTAQVLVAGLASISLGLKIMHHQNR